MTSRLVCFFRPFSLVFLLVGLLWGGLAVQPAFPQDGSMSEQQRRLLQVRHRQVELGEARLGLERVRELFDQGLVPEVELERSQSALEKAQLQYQEAVLSLLNLQPRVSIEDAVKHQGPDGRTFVRLAITNLTPTFDDTRLTLLDNFEGEHPIPEELRVRDIRDIFVSVQSPGGGEEHGVSPRGTTIGLPYEVHVPEIAYGDRRELEFQLLEDVSSLLVSLTSEGEVREIDIKLQQETIGGGIQVTSTEISQEADLGSEATFELRLERSTVDRRSFELQVLGLPRAVRPSFVDPETQARLSRINFPPGITQRDLSLRLFLPERSVGELQMDRPLELWAAVMDSRNGGLAELNGHGSSGAPEPSDGLPSQAVTAVRGGEEGATPALLTRRIEKLREHGAGLLRLEVIPRGVGELELSAASLFAEVVRGEPVATRFILRNAGTRRLDEVKIETEPPFDWRVETEPSFLTHLEVGEERDLDLRIVPPEDVDIGDYEVRIQAESSAYNRPLPTEDKIYRISVKARTDLLTTFALIGGLVVLVGGAVFGGSRLLRT